MERFHKTVGEEFFEIALRSTRYETVDQLQTDLDDWLDSYNYERPHLGYRNHGRRPFDTVKQFIKTGDGFKDESSTSPSTVPANVPANVPVGDLVLSL